MTEREAFVVWLETTKPPLPTTHDVEVAWRAWLARSEKVCTCAERPAVTEPLCPKCSDDFEAAANSTPA